MNIAIYAITESGCEKADQLASELNAKVFLPERFSEINYQSENISFYEKGEFSPTVKSNWKNFNAHIFIMATGIVVRNIALLMEHKTVDPAVVVCDEKGKYAISLLSGHIGGANRLAQQVAGILEGEAVITTATDVQGLTAFDEMASIEGWKVINPEQIKILNSLLLEAKPIGVVIPEETYVKYYSEKKSIILLENIHKVQSKKVDAVVSLDPPPGIDNLSIPVLKLDSGNE